MKFLKIRSIIISVVILFFALSSQPTYAKDYGFPDPENYVSDFANVISDTVESDLNTTLKIFENETSNQIFVVSVNDYGEYDMNDYAWRLFEQWGIGQEDNDNGILLLFKPEAEAGSRVRIEVGYGLEGAVPDSLSGNILDNYFMDSYFDEDYDTAVTSTVEQLKLATQSEYEGIDSDYSSEGFDWVGVGVFTFFIIWTMMASSKSWWLGGIIGFIAGAILGYQWFGWIGLIILPWPMIGIGLLMDFIASKIGLSRSYRGGFRVGSGGFSSFSGGGGGGFSGGGGGSSGGGGASR